MRRRLSIALVLLGVIVGRGLPALADPVSDKRAEAKRIATEREQLTQRAEQVGERSKQASDELATLEHELATSTQTLDSQRTAVGALQERLANLAVNAYTRGDDTGGLAGLIAADAANEAGLRRGYAPVVLGDQTDVLDQLRAARQDIDRATRDLDARLARQRQLVATITADRAEIDRTQAKLTTLAASVDRGLAAAVSAEQARQEAAAEAAAAARQRAEQAKRAAELAARQRADQANRAASAARIASANPVAAAVAPRAGSPGRNRPAIAATAPAVETIPVPPTSPAAGVAVAEALRQLGKPYVFATNGPDTFDCSGLTQWAWAHAGVAMPHYTVSQFDAFPHVPLDQLQPGDLVFFNIDLGHMGMYIGNGNIVQAPRTGDVVKISSLNGRNVVGAARPGTSAP